MGRKGSEWVWCGYELDIRDERLLIELQYQFSRQSHILPSKISEPFDIEFLFEGSEPSMVSDEEIEMQITAYEKQYGMTSEEFMRQMRDGTAPDEFETMSWMMLLRTVRDEYGDFSEPGIREDAAGILERNGYELYHDRDDFEDDLNALGINKGTEASYRTFKETVL